jgi:hypothetical protein
MRMLLKIGQVLFGLILNHLMLGVILGFLINLNKV